MSENKTGKYLKYAIGEIVLVVIGILIALSINNWNETGKKEREQVVFLNNLRNDLNSDLTQLDQILKFQSEKLKLINELKDLLIISSDFEKIERHFAKTQTVANDTYFPNTGSYSTAVMSGIIPSLKPSSLKIAITNLYERYYYRLTYNGELYDKRDDEVAFKRGKFFNKLTLKLNDHAVIDDSEFVNLVTIIISDNSYYVKLCTDTRIEILQVLELIDQQINN